MPRDCHRINFGLTSTNQERGVGQRTEFARQGYRSEGENRGYTHNIQVYISNY